MSRDNVMSRFGVKSAGEPKMIRSATLKYRPENFASPNEDTLRAISIEVAVNDQAYSIEKVAYIDELRSKLDWIFDDMKEKLSEMLKKG